MSNGKPDAVPLRPFAAEITAKYVGYSCQEVTHDRFKAFEAVIKCCADFDWDAAVPNMVYNWTGLTQAIGLRYYAVPGIDIPPDVTFQYREPSEQEAFMKREEYDELIEDPTRFLYEWGICLTFQKLYVADSRSRRNNQFEAKLLRPFGQRSDLLLAIPGFIVFGPFVNVLLSVFDEPVEQAS